MALLERPLYPKCTSTQPSEYRISRGPDLREYTPKLRAHQPVVLLPLIENTYFSSSVHQGKMSAAYSEQISAFISEAASGCKGLNYWLEIIQIILFILWAGKYPNGCYNPVLRQCKLVFSSTRIYMMSQGSSLLALAGLVLNLVPVGVNTCLWFAYTFYVLAPAFQGGLECATGYQNLSLATNSNSTNTVLELDKAKRSANCSPVAISTRTCVIAADILVLITTWYKTYSIKRDLTRAGIPSPLITLLLRDVSLRSRKELSGLLTNLTLKSNITRLSSVIVTHFLLNLREVTHKQTDDYSRESSDDPQATLRFASVIGSIGGNLDFDFEPFDNVEDVDDSSGCLKSELNSSAETKFSADSLGVAGHAMNVC
ncbi:hypothetical protein CERSUDRAFT_77082 [Gelatoporia subvermispora B]|uniref:Uncharacterized protein n=1 Tax=Ceriporiopsis subvermispora (strain B) TaxID=914234 RepID=M2QKM0_CERS8|nr:hypothetical protein CERSUDRAFT_77082 [Gelatoporia subvermispora B]